MQAEQLINRLIESMDHPDRAPAAPSEASFNDRRYVQDAVMGWMDRNGTDEPSKDEICRALADEQGGIIMNAEQLINQVCEAKTTVTAAGKDSTGRIIMRILQKNRKMFDNIEGGVADFEETAEGHEEVVVTVRMNQPFADAKDAKSTAAKVASLAEKLTKKNALYGYVDQGFAHPDDHSDKWEFSPCVVSRVNAVAPSDMEIDQDDAADEFDLEFELDFLEIKLRGDRDDVAKQIRAKYGDIPLSWSPHGF